MSSQDPFQILADTALILGYAEAYGEPSPLSFTLENVGDDPRVDELEAGLTDDQLEEVGNLFNKAVAQRAFGRLYHATEAQFVQAAFEAYQQCVEEVKR